MRYLFVLLSTLIMFSCTSIPLSTMVKLSTFNEQDLAKLDARDIRVKISVNSSVGLKVEETKLALSINNEHGELALRFPLEQVNLEKQLAEKGIFSDTPAFDIYHLKLSQQGVNDFKKLQKEIMTEQDQERGFGISVNAKLKDPDAFNDEKVLITISVKLSAEEDYFILIDNWQAKLGKSEL